MLLCCLVFHLPCFSFFYLLELLPMELRTGAFPALFCTIISVAPWRRGLGFWPPLGLVVPSIAFFRSMYRQLPENPRYMFFSQFREATWKMTSSFRQKWVYRDGMPCIAHFQTGVYLVVGTKFITPEKKCSLVLGKTGYLLVARTICILVYDLRVTFFFRASRAAPGLG